MRLARRFALLLLLAGIAAAASGEWEKIDEKDGIQVYRMEKEGSPLVAFKGVTVMEAPLEKILWVLADNEHKTEWIDLCSESTVLEQRSPHDFIVYQRYTLPWYLDDRDYVYRGKAVRQADGTVRLDLASCEHADAPDTVGVRARLIGSCYLLTPINERRTRLEVEIHTDPRGMVPDWLVNLVQKEWPLKTLKGVRDQVKKPYCKTYPLPPLEQAAGKK